MFAPKSYIILTKQNRKMKKFLMACAALIFCATATVQAQSYQFFNFGVKAGVNFSDLNQLENVETAVKSGFTGGAFLEIRPISLVGVQVEALYSNQGFIQTTMLGDATANLDYLEFPVMAKIYLLDGLSANIGIAPAFLLNSTVDFAGLSESGADTFQNAVFSLPIGVSWQFGCGLLLDARYKIPLSNIDKEVTIGNITEQALGGAKNGTFSLMVGWRF